MKLSLLACGGVLCLLGGANVANATAFVGIGSPVTLASLCTNVSGNGCTGNASELLTAGDKTFNDFFFNVVTATGATVPGQPPNLSQYDVQAGTYNGNYAIQVTGAFDAIAGSSGSAVLDITFGYDVTSSAGATIEDLGGHFDGACTGPGICSVSVTETGVSPDAPYNGSTVGQFTITNAPPGPLDADTGSFATPVTHLDVTKDINLVAFGAAGGNTTAQFSILDQYVSQVIPEPSFYGMLAFALVGLVWTYRREKRQVKQQN